MAPTVVVTLDVAQGELDALRPQLLLHLAAGVRGVVLGVGLRVEAVRDVVRAVETDGRVVLVEGAVSAGPHERTRMLAEWAVDSFAADWILPAVSGEFWWPRGASFDGLLASVPAAYATVQAIERPFVPVAEGDDDFAERMLYRASAHAPFGGADGAWRPARRLVCRAGADIDPEAAQAVGRGDSKLHPLRGWYPVEVLSFPYRSRDHSDALRVGQVEQGLATGALALDTRVRDALRVVAAGRPLAFPRPSIVDDALFAAEVAVLGEGDVVAARRVMDELEQRLTNVENRLGARLERKLRSVLGRGSG
jgi:hypothetical protein